MGRFFLLSSSLLPAGSPLSICLLVFHCLCSIRTDLHHVHLACLPLFFPSSLSCPSLILSSFPSLGICFYPSLLLFCLCPQAISSHASVLPV
ncbi:hypothetical protein CSUI_008999 [Cystoisospora suis]|uniref:Uncharacterized protein n=1 Tax=Cystoisospora suis TaxID=483139 RepID=A0A2C6KLB4_9APIC|nr:hypothetical protein CSUI_008999 [Cystoisospora suis]